MEKKIIAIIFSLVLIVGLTGAQAGSYDHEAKAKDMSFAWTIDGDTLHAKMAAKTDGWVAVGFNPSSKMKDANIIIGYIKDGQVTIADHFGDKPISHSSDKELGGTDDVTLVGGAEEGGMTTIEFTIPMNSSDKYDGVLSADGETKLIMAYGPDRDSLKPHHKYRTSKTIVLSTGQEK